MVVCLRYVLDDYEVCEDFVGLIQLENTTAETIYMSLKDCVIRCGLSFTTTSDGQLSSRVNVVLYVLIFQSSHLHTLVIGIYFL